MKEKKQVKKIFLRDIRNSRGLTMKELGKKVNVTESAIGQYETGKRYPNYEMLLKLGEALDCSVDDILTGIKEPTDVPAWLSEIGKKYSALDEHGQRLVDFILNAEYERCTAVVEEKPIIYIRHYLSSPAAGLNGLASDEYEDIPLPDDAPTGADFCVTVSGDSMEPYIHDQELVYVSEKAQLEDFDVGVFAYQGSTYIKQLCHGIGNQIYLLSANPKRENANVIIGGEDTNSLVCFGKVLLSKRLPQPIYN